MTPFTCHGCRWSRYHPETGGLWCALLKHLAVDLCTLFEYEPGASG